MFVSSRYWRIVFLLLMACPGYSATATNDYAELRQQMIKVIEADVRTTSLALNKKALDPRVIQALQQVPRHEFVPPQEQRFAYNNRPLPIGYGQTISQPYIVAIMTDLLGTNPQSRVLEVGTGSGYQAAVLAEIVAQVYSIEIIQPLGEAAKERLGRLGYHNVEVKIGDGYYGWEAHAPYDGIVVTAAASHVPPPLIKQLKPGGRMVIPVGSRFMTQELLLIEKTADNELITRQILPVMFVPLTGRH